MNILLVAQDPGPSRSFQKVAQHALDAHNVCTVLGRGANMAQKPEHNATLVQWADRVLVGMSSQPHYGVPELEYGFAAAAHNTAFGLFSDTFWTYRREHFTQMRDYASFLCVSCESELEEAHILFPNARVLAVGNPAWEDLVVVPLTKANARHELRIEDDTKVILCPGNKSDAIVPPNKNVQLVRFVHSALGRGNTVRIAFMMHPGDRADMSYYQSHIGNIADVIGKNDAARKSLYVRGCDAVVSACSPSTDLQALLLGTPAINIMDAEIEARLTREFGATQPPMAVLGLVPVVNMEDTTALRARLNTEWGSPSTVGRDLLPAMLAGASAKAIVDALTS